MQAAATGADPTSSTAGRRRSTENVGGRRYRHRMHVLEDRPGPLATRHGAFVRGGDTTPVAAGLDAVR